MTAKVKKYTNDRITIDALKYYVPLFHQGVNAKEVLDNDSYTSENYYKLLNEAVLAELVVTKIASLSGPLITCEINKIIASSHLKYNNDDIFDILYYAGLDGMRKGLKHFDVDKLNTSSTNYLFQWITTYAKKELSNLEAPFGVAASRFTKYKKIAAVRKKISDELGYYATNEEVYEYFQSGKADVSTMNGKLEKSDKPYKANKNITLNLIAEQENYELNLSNVEMLEDNLTNNNIKVVENRKNFEETIFGLFISKYNFNKKAIAVIKSELDFDLSKDEEYLINNGKYSYRSFLMRWKDLLKDKNGLFYDFLLDYRELLDDQDVNELIDSINKNGKDNIPLDRYSVLFEEDLNEV